MRALTINAQLRLRAESFTLMSLIIDAFGNVVKPLVAFEFKKLSQWHH